jgi:hypothetical protein
MEKAWALLHATCSLGRLNLHFPSYRRVFTTFENLNVVGICTTVLRIPKWEYFFFDLIQMQAAKGTEANYLATTKAGRFFR